MIKDELKPIDTSKYKITKTGQVLKMTKDEKQIAELEKQIAELEQENRVLKCFIRDLIYENHNTCFHFNNTTCLFNSDYRNRAEELIGEKL